jgi:hypothetical protein
VRGQLSPGWRWRGLKLLLLRRSARPAEQEEGEGGADSGEDGAGEEGGLEAFGEGERHVAGAVLGDEVVGASDGDGGDDCDADRRADLERRVAES